MDAFIVEGNVSLWYLWRYRWAFGLVGMRLVLCLLHQAQAPLCCLHPTCLTPPPSPSPSGGRMVGLCFSLFPIYSISIPNPVLPRPSSPGDSLAEAVHWTEELQVRGTQKKTQAITAHLLLPRIPREPGRDVRALPHVEQASSQFYLNLKEIQNPSWHLGFTINSTTSPLHVNY